MKLIQRYALRIFMRILVKLSFKQNWKQLVFYCYGDFFFNDYKYKNEFLNKENKKKKDLMQNKWYERMNALTHFKPCHTLIL